MSTDTEIEDAEIISTELVAREVPDTSTALMAINKSEIDIQIATAKKYPRSITKFKREVKELACLSEQTAASMFYSLPRGGKRIEGPSVRLAEIAGSAWGNLRYGARIISTDDKFVTAQGACCDMEKNIAITFEVKRRITKKDGTRYDDDMIQTTSAAAQSIALREAVFKVIPRALINEAYEQAKLTSIGKAESMSATRQKMLDWFNKTGVAQQAVLDLLGRKGVEDIGVDDLIHLKGLATAIRDGETTIEQAFQLEGKTGAKVKASKLNDTLEEPAKPKREPRGAKSHDPWDLFLDGLKATTTAQEAQTFAIENAPKLPEECQADAQGALELHIKSLKSNSK